MIELKLIELQKSAALYAHNIANIMVVWSERFESSVNCIWVPNYKPFKNSHEKYLRNL